MDTSQFEKSIQVTEMTDNGSNGRREKKGKQKLGLTVWSQSG